MLTALKPSARAAATLLTGLNGRLGTPAGRRILLAWLLLKGRTIQLDLFGLDYSLKQVCRLETASGDSMPFSCCRLCWNWKEPGADGRRNGGGTGLCNSRLLHLHAGA